MLIVWCLSFVPNLVIVTEIDALMLQVVNPYGDWYTGRWYSFDDVTQIDFRFRQLVMWSSPDGHDASSYQIW